MTKWVQILVSVWGNDVQGECLKLARTRKCYHKMKLQRFFSSQTHLYYRHDIDFIYESVLFSIQVVFWETSSSSTSSPTPPPHIIWLFSPMGYIYFLILFPWISIRSDNDYSQPYWILNFYCCVQKKRMNLQRKKSVKTYLTIYAPHIMKSIFSLVQKWIM